jgi:outer membrane protein
MKKIIIALSMILAFTFTALPDVAEAKDLKIVHANLQRALNESDAGKKAKSELEEETKALEKELNAEQEQLKKMKDEIESKRAVWNKQTVKEKEEEFIEEGRAFQKRFMQYRDDITKKLQQREAAIIEDLKKVVDAIAEKEGYDFIFESSLGGLVYAPDSTDITDDIIDAYNKSKK